MAPSATDAFTSGKSFARTADVADRVHAMISMGILGQKEMMSSDQATKECFARTFADGAVQAVLTRDAAKMNWYLDQGMKECVAHDMPHSVAKILQDQMKPLRVLSPGPKQTAFEFVKRSYAVWGPTVGITPAFIADCKRKQAQSNR